MADSSAARFSPELEAAADAIAKCAGFPTPPASTSGGTSPAHVLGEPCSRDTQAPVGDIAPKQCSVLLDRGACL